MANDREFIIQPLITEGKVVKLTDIDPITTYIQIGVWQDNQRQAGSSGNAYPSYVIPISELSGTTYAGDGITIDLLPGNIFAFASMDISQFTNDSGYITAAAIPSKTPLALVQGGGGAIPWAYGSGYNAYVTLTQNGTLTITGLQPGDYGTLKLIQGVGGPYTITLPVGSLVSNNGGGIMTLQASVGEHDILSFYIDELGIQNWTLSPQFT